MKVTILMGSPRKNGNTFALLQPFMDTLKEGGTEHSLTWLYDKDIRGCIACRACQKDWTKFGCSIRDDMPEIFEATLGADLLLLATPIYSWYCTAPMKAVLDRLVYGMNKYYGEAKGPALWSGKRLALLITCGYAPEKGADLFEDGIRRYCRHSSLRYSGALIERHMGYSTVFMDEEKSRRSREFAASLLASS